MVGSNTANNIGLSAGTYVPATPSINKPSIAKVGDKTNNPENDPSKTASTQAEQPSLPTAVVNALQENATLKSTLDQANQYAATLQGKLGKYSQMFSGPNQQQAQASQAAQAQQMQQMQQMQMAQAMMGGGMGGARAGNNWGENGAEKPPKKRKPDGDNSNYEKDESPHGQGLKDIVEKPETNSDEIKPIVPEQDEPKKKVKPEEPEKK